VARSRSKEWWWLWVAALAGVAAGLAVGWTIVQLLLVRS
jgi:high-affinity Fe2+/Pb2+ permease